MDPLLPPVDTSYFDSFLPNEQAPVPRDARGIPVTLYPICNEHDVKSVYKRLDELDVLGRCVITLSGIHGLEQFARRPDAVDYCLHIDFNPLQKRFWSLLLTAIADNSTSKDAINTILVNFPKQFQDPKAYQKLQRYFQDDHIFSIPRCWDKVKIAVKHGKILSLSVDFSCNNQLDLLERALKESGLTIDTFYTSNLNNKRWLGPDRVEEITTRIRLMQPEQKLHVILARRAKCTCSCPLFQKVITLSSSLTKPPKVQCTKNLGHKLRCINKVCMQILNWHSHCTANHQTFRQQHRLKEIGSFILTLDEITMFAPNLAMRFETIVNCIDTLSTRSLLSWEQRAIEVSFPEISKITRSCQQAISPLCMAAIFYATKGVENCL